MSTKLRQTWINLYADCDGSSADETAVKSSKRLAHGRWWAEMSRVSWTGTFCDDGSVRAKKEKQKIDSSDIGGSNLN